MRTVRCSGRRGGGSLSQCMLGYREGVRLGVSAQRGVCSNACWDTSPCEQNDWQTGVKTLPFHNFIADGNKKAF